MNDPTLPIRWESTSDQPSSSNQDRYGNTNLTSYKDGKSDKEPREAHVYDDSEYQTDNEEQTHSTVEYRPKINMDRYQHYLQQSPSGNGHKQTSLQDRDDDAAHSSQWDPRSRASDDSDGEEDNYHIMPVSAGLQQQPQQPQQPQQQLQQQQQQINHQKQEHQLQNQYQREHKYQEQHQIQTRPQIPIQQNDQSKKGATPIKPQQNFEEQRPIQDNDEADKESSQGFCDNI
jgi:hypothetical protein